MFRYIILSLALTAASLPAAEALAMTPTAPIVLPASASGIAPLLSVSASASAAKKKSSKKKSSSKKKKGTTTSSKKKKGTSGKRPGKKTRVKKTRASSSAGRWSNPQAPPKETPQNDSLTLAVNEAVIAAVPPQSNPGGLRVNAVKPDLKNRVANVALNENFTYLPVTTDLILDLQRATTSALPDSLKRFRVDLSVGRHPLAYYIMKIDKMAEEARKPTRFVVDRDPLANPRKGLVGDIIALWHSHGRYYKPSSGAWQWQRPLLFQSIEDTYTMSYILPYVVPMLENAGAYVMLPRERDTSRHEVIVDNDINPEGEIYSQTTYLETDGSKKWTDGEEEGFIYDLEDFRDTENPFENGTYRQAETVRNASHASEARWYADIPEDGEYALYVSYHSLPESAPDARYTVNYSGGKKEFSVNQTMGGSTWIYLGTFPFEEGYDAETPVVSLSNVSDHGGTIVTADAIKIGGGMGNIARSPRRSDIYWGQETPAAPLSDGSDRADAAETPDDAEAADGQPGDGHPEPGDNPFRAETPAQSAPAGRAPQFRTSGLPRYLEGARYWLQWAGMPEEVYSPYNGTDDYKDDYTSRGRWVNRLAGGSRVLPDEEGLGIPVDVAMALHSDAGKRADDSYVGTLGIYFTNGGDSYEDGTRRINSRMLTDLLMRQITGDIRQLYDPAWTRRSMWDKSYVEARVPEVPTALIELLSHQNFADMRLGLDPTFRFTVGRAIYKALARFVAARKGREVVIQPLPVKDFAITRSKRGHYRLTWDWTPDPLEPTAAPNRYIIMERAQDELGWHKIGETRDRHFDVRTDDRELHSLQVIAVNDGGLSFPSETLAFREGERDEAPVMVVNGFTRLSGPAWFSEDGRAGFRSDEDFGVPYIRDISFTGPQTEFRRSAGESFGRSSGSDIDMIIAGNTFDYPALHGSALQGAGRGFVSASVGAVMAGDVKLSDYKAVDLILGKQKTTLVGRDTTARYEAFPPKLRDALERYLDKGGRLMVSGAYVASDLLDPRASAGGERFAEKVLGVLPDTLGVSRSGRIDGLAGAMKSGLQERSYRYSNTLNEQQYIVERPDALRAAPGAKAEEMLSFSDTDGGAGYLVKRGKGKVAVMSVPFESLTDPNQREHLMRETIDWLLL
ncbi:MAG: xanthan lyase [Muribaculaceae bacterium]|nr:xanthan lyase [Muribaculaceae bacterium]